MYTASVIAFLFVKVSNSESSNSEDREVVLNDVLMCNVDALSSVSSPNVTVITPLILVLLCRVARTWNQTGDKWAHLPDVSDWLVRQVLVLLQCYYNDNRQIRALHLELWVEIAK